MVHRVFICHSADDPTVDGVLKELRKHLCGPDFDILVDVEVLQLGDEWRNEICAWIGMCDSAVILLSEGAFNADKPWVFWEASLLTWRHIMQDDFLVIPAFLEGVDPDRLANDPRFKELRLSQLQGQSLNKDPVTLAAALADRIKTAAADASMRSGAPAVLNFLTQQIEGQLRDIDINILEVAAKELELDLGPWRPQQRPARLLALKLLHTPLGEAIAPLEHLSGWGVAAERFDRILNILKPSWIDLRAAQTIVSSVRDDAPAPCVIINTSNMITTNMFVSRAHGKPLNDTAHRTLSITTRFGENAVEDIGGEITEALINEFERHLVVAPDDPDQLEQEILETVADLKSAGKPVYVALFDVPGAVRVIPALQRRFPAVHFIMVTGDDLPADEDCPFPVFVKIEPELLPDQEKNAFKGIQRANIVFEGVVGR